VTRIVAILLLAGQFQVSVETSSGYFTATYPDTHAGVRRFSRALQEKLIADPGRFYPCIVHEKSTKELSESPLVLKIGPGTANGTSIVGPDHLKRYFANQPTKTIDSVVAEKICMSNFPPDYKTRFPATAGVREFYRRPPPPTAGQIAMVGTCEAVLAEVIRSEVTLDNLNDKRSQEYGRALGNVRLWAADQLEPAGMNHPTYARAFRIPADQLRADNPGRTRYIDENQDKCIRLATRLD
jgi:hypothetical protein